MQAVGRGAGLALVLALPGCGRQQNIDPVAWWHGLEGGAIAEKRPPPPDATAPYPNLATVPPRPKPIDAALRARVSAALTADRANAIYEAKQDPLGPAPPKAPSGLFAAAKPLPPPAADTAGAALQAAGPPAPAAPAPAAPPKPRASPPTVVHDAAPELPPPAIPAAPPPPPHLAGVAIPVTVPHLPPVAPPPAPVSQAALTEAGRAPLSLGFPDGSAILPIGMLAPLRALAARRDGRGIAIVGFGDGGANDAFSQGQGVRLGVARARAVAVALRQYGVPMAALHLGAEAAGRGAAARLLP